MVKTRSGKDTNTQSQTSPFKDYLTTYINSTKFQIIHTNNVVMVQRWMYLNGLKYTPKDSTPGNRFNEYFLDTNSPIKVVERESKYWIIDGHHRYVRGLLMGYKYFLVEVSNVYNPCETTEVNEISFTETRPSNEHTNRIEVSSFNMENEEILKKVKLLFPHIKIKRHTI